MDTLFCILSLFSLSIGLLNLGGLFFLRYQQTERGTWSLVLHMLPLLLITILLAIEHYLEYRYPAVVFTFIPVWQ